MRIFVTASRHHKNAAQVLPITIPSGITSIQSRIAACTAARADNRGVEFGGSEAFTSNTVELAREYQKRGQSKDDPADFVCEPADRLR